MQPLVSIIIPYFNRLAKLERCINSIDAQIYKNYEIIVIDDCSSVPFESNNDKIQIIRNEMNSGPGTSRNYGMNLAQGTYIAFLDSDDYWHPNFLDVLVTAMQKDLKAVMAYAEGFNVDNSEAIVGAHRNKGKHRTSILPKILYSGRAWGTGACLWRAQIIKDVKWISTRSWEDYAFDVAVSVINNNIISIDQQLVYFDASGSDKLSKQDEKFVAIEKNKSILDISNTLIKAGYKNDPIIRKSITILIILRIVKLTKNSVRNVKLILNNIKSIKQWRSFRFSFYILILFFIPNRLSMKYLMRLKQRVNQDRIQVLGK